MSTKITTVASFATSSPRWRRRAPTVTAISPPSSTSAPSANSVSPPNSRPPHRMPWDRCLVPSTCPYSCARATARPSIYTPRPWGTRFIMWRLSIMQSERCL